MEKGTITDNVLNKKHCLRILQYFENIHDLTVEYNE